ncbi:MAG: leucine-rich repeat domain-containing protein, partial [Corallococcus sp.]|nr:leucine-rich repeat domain-containing protein [Corallococcus sp.]
GLSLSQWAGRVTVNNAYVSRMNGQKARLWTSATAAANDATSFSGTAVNANALKTMDIDALSSTTTKAIQQYAFWGYDFFASQSNNGSSSNKDLVIPTGVTHVYEGAFGGNKMLASIDVPFVGNCAVTAVSNNRVYSFGYIFGTISSAGHYAAGQTNATYYFPTTLTTVTVRNGATINYYAFQNCNKIETINLPDNLQASSLSIGQYAFDGCTALKKITIPQNANTIMVGAFRNCSALREVVFAGTAMRTVQSNAFQNTKINKVNIPGIYNWLDITFADAYANPFCGQVTGSVLTYTQDGSLKELHDMKDIKTDATLKTYAFWGYDNWYEMKDGVKVNRLYVPTTITAINIGALGGAKSLLELSLPFVGYVRNVGYLYNNRYNGYYSFGYIWGKTAYTGGIARYQNVYDSYNGYTNTLFYIPAIEKVEIRGGNLLHRAFDNCADIREIYMPDTYQERIGYDEEGNILTATRSFTGNNAGMGEYVFLNCTNLERAVVSNYYTSTSHAIFQGCNRMQFVQVPFVGYYRNAWGNNYRYFGNMWNTTNNTNANNYVPSTLKEAVFTNGNVGQNAFYGCQYLEKITLGDTMTNGTYLSNACFYNCNRLREIYVSQRITIIYEYAFRACRSLEKMTLPFVGYTSGLAHNNNGKFGWIFGNYTDTSSVLTRQNYSTGNNESLNTYYDCRVPTTLREVTILGGAIASGAFSNMNMIETITLPETGTNTMIGSYAFYNCTALTSSRAVKSTTVNGTTTYSHYIDEETGDYAVGPFRIPVYFTYIYQNAFDGATGLTEIKLHNRITNVSINAFNNCRLSTVYADDLASFLRINFGYTSSAAINAAAQTNNLHANPLYIANVPLKYKNNPSQAEYDTLVDLTDEHIAGDSSIILGSYCLAGYTFIESVELGGSVSQIKEGAFYACPNITTVDLAYVTTVGNYAFYNTGSMVDVTLDGRLTTIGLYAFANSSLQTLWYEGNEKFTINQYAFYNCTKLETLDIGDYRTEIASTTSSIGDRAFDGCSGLRNITIGNCVKTIGAYAFNLNRRIKNLTLGNNVRTIGSNAFAECAVQHVKIYSLEAWCLIDFADVLSNPLYHSRALTVNSREITELEIPRTNASMKYHVTSVKKFAFVNCNFTSILVPSEITEIGEQAFRGCTSLEEITLPFTGRNATTTNVAEYTFGYIFGKEADFSTYEAAVNSSTKYYLPETLRKVTITGEFRSNTIYSNTFINCKSIEEITFSSVNVTTIQSGVFQGCAALTNISIPQSVTSIQANAFNSCSSLNRVYIDDLTKWCNIAFGNQYANPLCYGATLVIQGIDQNNITISADITAIKAYTFYGCGSLESVTVANNLSSIATYAFAASNINRITLRDVTTIDNYAFQNCTQLHSITMQTIGTITTNALKGCSNLEEITFDKITTAQASAFLIVPSGSSFTAAKLKKVNVSSLDNWLATNFADAYANPLCGQEATLFVNGDELHDLYSINKNVDFKQFAFWGYDKWYETTPSGSIVNKLHVPDYVVSMGLGAMGGAKSLKELSIPYVGYVKTVGYLYNNRYNGYYTFGYMWGKTAYTGGIARYQNVYDSYNGYTNTLFYIPAIEKVEIRGGNLLHRAFDNCADIREIYMPDTYQERIGYDEEGNILTATRSFTGNNAGMGEYVFLNCTNLERAVVSNYYTSTSHAIFQGCNRMQFVQVPFVGYYRNAWGNNYRYFGNMWNTTNNTNANNYVPSTLKEAVFTNGNVGQNAFYGCQYLEKITLGDTMTNGTYLSNACFYNCNRLREIYVSQRITIIYEYAFRACRSLEKMTLPFAGYDASERNNNNGRFGWIFGNYTDTNSASTIQKYSTNNSASANANYTCRIPANLREVTILGGAISSGAFAGIDTIEVL